MATLSEHTARQAQSSGRTALVGLGQGAWRSALVTFSLTIVVLWLANLVAFQLRPAAYRVDVGTYRDSFWLSGTYPIEAAEGRSYRWTSGQATLEFFGIPQRQPTLFEIESSGRPEGTSITLLLNGKPWTSVPIGLRTRAITLLLPPNLPNHLLVGMQSPTFQAPGDPRELGVILDSFALRIIGGALAIPTDAMLLAQIGVLIGAQLVIIRLGGGRRSQLLTTSVIAIGLAIIAVGVLPISYVYLLRLATAALIIAGLTWAFLPLAERQLAWAGTTHQIRILWALMLIAIVIRLSGVLFPSFAGQDLGRNLKRMDLAINGQHVIIAGSSEFADGQTIYPTGPYIAIMPLFIVMSDHATATQAMLATIDGIGALFVGLLVLRLGGSQTAARIAIVLYAGSLTAFSALVFSFSAQIFGQWFTAPILLLLCQPGALDRPRTWLLGILALAFGVFSHIGVAILGIAWFSALLALMLIFRRGSPGWCWGAIALVGLLLGAVAFLYGEIAVTTLAHIAALLGGGGGGSGFVLKGASPLLWKALRLAFTDAGVVLLPLALVLFFARPPSRDATLAVGAMTLTALVFFLVDLSVYLQVRYLYFMLPLALALIARLLGTIATYGRLGRLAAWALCLALTISTVTLWYASTWGDYQITMTPLTH